MGVTSYRIEFLQKPYQHRKPPQIAFTKKEKECMQAEIQSMLDKQAFSEIRGNPQGFFFQMFLVPKKNGRQRPVITLKRLNQSVKTEHFKMEGIHMLKNLLRAGDWMANIDLKDAYFMVPMAKDDRDFLKFQWEDRFYQFICLPFRLSSAPWVFTKTTRSVVATLRGVGTASNYLHRRHPRHGGDRDSPIRPYQSSNIPAGESGVCDQQLQVRANPHPGDRIPRVYSQLHQVGAQTTRGEDQEIRTEVGKALQSHLVSALTLSHLIGKMNVATQAIPMAPLYYRNLQACLREALQEEQSYSILTSLTKEAREELQWWRDHFTQWNGRSLIAHDSFLTIETNASKKGWGAVCNGVHTGGPWSPREQTMHINCLELLAAFLTVQCFAKNKQSK